MNHINVKILRKEGETDVWVEAYMSPNDAQELFDMKISRVSNLATPESKYEQNNEMDIAFWEDQQALWQWKFLLDIVSLGH